jgi:hypothetical protein
MNRKHKKLMINKRKRMKWTHYHSPNHRRLWPSSAPTILFAAGVPDTKVKSGNDTLDSFAIDVELGAADNASGAEDIGGAADAVSKPNLRLQ